MNELILAVLQSMVTPVGIAIMFTIVTILEVVKIYLPDNLEPKLLPVLAIVIGGIIGGLIGNLLQGILAGICATGSYALIEKNKENIGKSLEGLVDLLGKSLKK